MPSPAHPVTHWAAPMDTLPCQIPLPLLWKGTRNHHSLLPSFWPVIPIRRRYLLFPGRYSSLRQVGDVAKNLSEIQVEYIKKNIIFLKLWLNPSKKNSSNLQSLTFLWQANTSQGVITFLSTAGSNLVRTLMFWQGNSSLQCEGDIKFLPNWGLRGLSWSFTALVIFMKSKG